MTFKNLKIDLTIVNFDQNFEIWMYIRNSEFQMHYNDIEDQKNEVECVWNLSVTRINLVEI